MQRYINIKLFIFLKQMSLEKLLRTIFIVCLLIIIGLSIADINKLLYYFNDAVVKENIIYLRALIIKALVYLLLFYPIFEIFKYFATKSWFVKFSAFASSIKFSSAYKNYMHVLLLSLLLLPLLYRMARIGFLSDAYYDLMKSSKGFIDIFKYRGWEGGHYSPLYYTLIYIEYSMFGFNAFYYHLVKMIIHILNAYLVFHIAMILFKDKLLSIVSSLIFATYFTVYGNLLVITHLQSTMMTTTFLGALIFFIKYLNNKRTLYYTLYLMMFIISILLLETAYVILIVCLLYDILFKNEKMNFRRYNIYILPIIFILIHFSLLTEKAEYPFVSIFVVERVILSALGYIFSMNNINIAYLITRVIYFKTSTILVTGIIILIFIILYKYANRYVKFVFLAGLISMIPPLLVRNVPDILRMGIYIYLATAYFSIIIAYSLLKIRAIVIEYLNKNNSKSLIIAKRLTINLFFSSIVFIMIKAGISYQNEAITQYIKANEIKNSILAETKRLLPKVKDMNVYYLNVPAFIYNYRVKAEVFRRGLKEALYFEYGGEIGQIYENLDKKDLDSLVELRGFERDAKNIILSFDPMLNSIRMSGGN